MPKQGSRIADMIMWEYEKKAKARSKKIEKDLQIGEEIYMLRRKKYNEDRYQKGIIVGKYSKHFCVEFKCEDGSKYRESFNYIGAEYKKELSEDDSIYKNAEWN